ncbi:hypothetical protein O181_080971 [Austropuccinia psidii MF-1]|uniref:DUF4939 domain-containing protein n=1 Tax=Austropuccinia psidii MF-1 TaxID=1389203 RepID=A0A9Q3IFG4_9BASI|nr:hypothetical protein [Austropuccinia psidii MF-1]
MPIQHSPPAKQTRSHARAQAVLTPAPRAPLDRISAEEDNYEEEEESDDTEGVPAPVKASKGTGGPALDQSDQHVFHKSEPSFLAIMEQITQIMPNLQAASSSEASRPPALKTPSMKAPEFFVGNQPFKFRSIIRSFQFLSHKYLANFSQDRNKVLYATSFLIDRAATWIEPYFSDLTNQDPNYLLKSWTLFESQLFTLFGNSHEVIKSDAKLDPLTIKKGGHFFYKSLISEVWFEELEIGVKGLSSTISEKDYHPGFWINWPPILQ